jgi:hypothetical protein
MSAMDERQPDGFARFLKAFLRMDRRWIFAAVAAITLGFMTVNLRLPVTPTEQARGVFKAIESLPPGARVHLSVDYGPGSEAELWPMQVVMLRQLFRRDAKVICSSLWTDGPPMIERGFREVLAQLEKEGIRKQYGTDFVNLGFKAGDRVAIAKIASSFKETFPLDAKGNRTADLPIMQGWDNYQQVDLLITLAVGDPGAPEYIQQAQSRYGVKMVAGVTAVISPQLYPFYQSGNLQGFLGGLAGAAEYEVLAAEPGLAIRGMNVQSAVHLYIVVMVLLGNLAALLLRMRGERVR